MRDKQIDYVQTIVSNSEKATNWWHVLFKGIAGVWALLKIK